MSEFQWPMRVYIEDTDAGGIVYYVNYLKFMERSRTEFMRTLGVNKAAMLADDLMLVVHSAQVNYRRPAYLDDQLIVSSAVIKLSRTYVVFMQRVMRADELVCEGEVKVACVTRSSMRPSALPVKVVEEIKQRM